MSSIIRVLVVDDHPLFAQATKQVLEELKDVEVVGIAANAWQCMEQLTVLEPHIVLLDYQLPDQLGTKVAKQIKEQYPSVHIIMFTGIEAANLFEKFIALEVSGILSKEANPRVIQTMVYSVIENYTMLPIQLFHSLDLRDELAENSTRLTEQEVTMMNYVVKGATQEQIADRIHMSKRSVDNYMKKVYNKLGANSRIEAVEKFIQSKYYI